MNIKKKISIVKEIKMQHSHPTAECKIEAPPPIELIEEMIISLQNPEIHIYNTLNQLYEMLSFYIYDVIPINCLIILYQLFLSSNFDDDNFEENDIEEEESYDRSTILGLSICVIYSLVISSKENKNIYFDFFMKPDIVNKLFELYDIIPKAGDLINYMAKNRTQFILDYRDNIAKLLNTTSFSCLKADLLFEAIKVDNNFFPIEKLLEKFNSALISKNDTNLYIESLEKLILLVQLIPNEIIPFVVPKMHDYIDLDGDHIDDYQILKLYSTVLPFLKSFDSIVDEHFIALICKILSGNHEQIIKKYALEILNLDYDLTPFLKYPNLFEMLLNVFANSSFLIQKLTVIFIAKIMQICNKDQINYFMNSVVVDNISNFLTVNDNDIVFYSLLLISTVMKYDSEKDWPDDIIDTIEDLSFNSNEQIAQISQMVEKQLQKD
ncbi:hypothetical protein M9Y10_002390 [Tritrichomonas musculus]|uniref:Uncharacterized protein n=1 Tax=Tritrichomonas musculus TaxID=1915356 RepID=A0ABR2L9P4_9EUKA